MDEALPISPNELYARLGTARAPVVVDLRRQNAFDAEDTLIVGAIRRSPAEAERWLTDLPPDRAVVMYCGTGGEGSPEMATMLRRAGIQAAYLEGDIAGWEGKHLPTRRKRGAAENKWVTREHPKIDR